MRVCVYDCGSVGVYVCEELGGWTRYRILCRHGMGEWEGEWNSQSRPVLMLHWRRCRYAAEVLAVGREWKEGGREGGRERGRRTKECGGRKKEEGGLCGSKKSINLQNISDIISH